MPAGGLDDHAALATALLTLFTVTGDTDWRTAGFGILDRAIDVFADRDEAGSWYDAAGDGLIARPRDPVDGATPAGASLMAEALLLASGLAGVDDAARYTELLDATLARGAVLLAKLARSAGHWLAVAQARVAGPMQIAVAQASRSDGKLARAARELAAGGTIRRCGRTGFTTAARQPGAGRRSRRRLCVPRQRVRPSGDGVGPIGRRGAHSAVVDRLAPSGPTR